MNSFDDPYEVQAERVATIQRRAGWSEYSEELDGLNTALRCMRKNRKLFAVMQKEN